jgi:hypothetical protein
VVPRGGEEGVRGGEGVTKVAELAGEEELTTSGGSCKVGGIVAAAAGRVVCLHLVASICLWTL